jgi:D-lyxose ketol-isomerase
MKNEDISKLVDEFVRRIKLYKTEYGQDEFWNLGLNLYTNELKDWHSAQHFPEESKITKERLTIIMNVLLDAISYMSKKNIKESMKKSELKSLIREVIEETQSLEKAIGYKEPYAVGIAQKLKNENEKLRAALQEIIELEQQESLGSYGFGDIARKALSQ